MVRAPAPPPHHQCETQRREGTCSSHSGSPRTVAIPRATPRSADTQVQCSVPPAPCSHQFWKPCLREGHSKGSPEDGSRASFPGYRTDTVGDSAYLSCLLARMCRGYPHLVSGSSSRELSDPKGLLPFWKAWLGGPEDSVVAKQGMLHYCHSTSRGRWRHCSQPLPELWI